MEFWVILLGWPFIIFSMKCLKKNVFFSYTAVFLFVTDLEFS
jgi:uncharacterized membrane-anchored protein YitT (DUF2179 family)